MLSRCFLDFSVGVEALVIGPSQISSFFSCEAGNNYTFGSAISSNELNFPTRKRQ